MTNTQKIVAIPAIAALLLAGGAVGGYASFASAQTDASSSPQAAFGKMHGMGKGKDGRGRHHGHGVAGTVSAVSGTTLTVLGMDGTTYTVDAASTTVKRMVTGSLGDVQVGDTIGVRGTLSGTSVTATEIMDDLPPKPAQAP